MRVNGQLAVGRLGRQKRRRSRAGKPSCCRHLDREGMTVPVPIPTRDGRTFVDGLVVMTYVEGSPPETEADWRRVAETFRQLHRLTHGWPQRPGWRSSVDFLDVDTGTRIDLGAMPPRASLDAGRLGRGSLDVRRCVVHGDPNPRQHPHDRGSSRADRLGRIARRCSRPRLVLPYNAADLDDDTHSVAAQAWAAWDAALCFTSGYHEFAAERLAEVRAV